MSRFKAFLLWIWVMGLLLWRPALAQTSKLSGKIVIDGSSTVYPITEAVAEEFSKIYPPVKTSVAFSGTGGGFKKFGRNEIDISDASRPIRESEMKLCQENGVFFIELPIAIDALAVVVHPKNDWVDYLTVQELRLIWSPESQGKIIRWNQIRPQWPNQEIRLYGPGTASGTFDYFTEAIMGKSGSSRGDYTASEDDNVLVQGIATDRYALGYFGVAYYEENRDKLKAVPIDDENDANGKGAFHPTRENAEKAYYQPLSRPLFIYVNTASLQRPEVKEFVRFYLDNVPQLAAEVGYIPFSSEVYKMAKLRFEKGIVGSIFWDMKPGENLIEIFKAKQK